MNVSSRISQLAESATLAISARAKELRAAGRNVISLSAGEPDFATPERIAVAAGEGIGRGWTRYTAVAGAIETRRAVTQHLERDYGLSYDVREVAITAGVKSAIHLALMALLEAGDEVVVLSPYWVSYPALVTLAGGRAKIIDCPASQDFVPDFGELEAALASSRCRAILVNSPSNPTGKIWSRSQIQRLVELCTRHDIAMLSDEIYRDISFGVEVTSPAQIEGGRELSLVFNGLSKSYAMTGWRLGWVAGPRELVDAIQRAQGQIIGNACSVSQFAAITALDDAARPEVDTMVEEFARRRDYIVPALQALPGVEVVAPDGAFYAFANIDDLLAKCGGDDIELAKRILEEVEVALVPGSAFGAPGHVRVSFAASMEDLQEAIGRLQRFAESI